MTANDPSENRDSTGPAAICRKPCAKAQECPQHVLGPVHKDYSNA